MMLNLEPLAAQASLGMTAQGSGSDCDRLITKAAAVLAEQGLFAFGLFLFSRKRNGEPEIARNILRSCRALLAQARLAPLHEERDEPSYWKGLGEQRDGEDGATALRRLLLTKQLVELALNYGRYRAKGMD
jgi:hypothetical protein